MSASGTAATALAVRPARSLSPSRASDFVACPLLFRFRTIDRLPEPPSAAAARGTLVHSVLENLFSLPPGDRTLAQATAMLPQCWEVLLCDEPELAQLVACAGDGETPDLAAWLGRAADLLAGYFALEDPTQLEPVGRELAVEVELPSGLTLRGLIDRLDEAPDGSLRVVDYKTGRAPGPGFEANAMFQMRFYALALWHERGVVPGILQLMYLSNGVILRYEPDEIDLRGTQRKVEAVWTAIERATLSGDWRANRSRRCDWCAHRSICPEWGGQPPPLPESRPAAPPTRPDEPSATR